ncbi:MAG: cysteine desulfurase [Candidatus Kerfeldbacteria bacterium]|nr:cysteine desulfurase [Candidatus Kerfeldbacteria bacterium]
MLSTETIKNDFPMFKANPKLVYLDSTATSLKPQAVIDAEREYYEQYGVNVHRGVYALSVRATDAYEGAREKVRKFINAKSTKEIIFTRNATEAINLVANTFGKSIGRGDAILTTEMEHHSNIVPWLPPPTPSALRAAPPNQGGAELRWIRVTDNGELDLSNLGELLKGVKLVAITQMSNVLGMVNDVKMIAKKAHSVGAKILVDAAQSTPHMPVDVQDLDADFLVFSGHKMLAPTGIGALYAKQEILQDLPPFLRGGDMILEVTKEGAQWNELPWKFEAGTPNIAGTIGLGAAIDYLQKIGMDNVWQHEQELTRYGLEQLSQISGVKVLGAPTTPAATPPLQGGVTSPPPTADARPSLGKLGIGRAGGAGRGAIFAFTIDGVHPHDIGSILDEQGVAIRAGHHCAMILHRKFGLPATARASCYLYNSKKDIDQLVKGIIKIQGMFA